MPSSRKRLQPVFLSSEDEGSFQNLLKLEIDSVLFIDGIQWPTSTPPTKLSITECASPVIYIWNKMLHPTLPFLKLPSGLFQGPSSGVVIQFVRCRLKNGALEQGDIAVGYDVDHVEFATFVTGVWKILKKLNSCSLEFVDRLENKVITQNINDCVVGEHANQLSKDGILLTSGRTDCFYRVQPSASKAPKTTQRQPRLSTS